MLWDRAEVAGRLEVLRRADPGLTRFGAEAHQYLLNQPLTPSEVTAFEARYGLSLPGEYRSFLLEVGDGGAGPFYGIFRLDHSDLPDWCDDDLLPGFLAGEFPTRSAGMTSATRGDLNPRRSTPTRRTYAVP